MQKGTGLFAGIAFAAALAAGWVAGHVGGERTGYAAGQARAAGDVSDLRRELGEARSVRRYTERELGDAMARLKDADAECDRGSADCVLNVRAAWRHTTNAMVGRPIVTSR